MDSLVGMLPAGVLLWFLATYNSCSETAIQLFTFYGKLRTAFTDVFFEKYWYAFRSYPTLFDSNKVAIYPSGSARVEWMYNPSTKTFYEWTGSEYSTLHSAQAPRPLPLLSMELVEGEGAEEEVGYDLTDFLEGMRIVNATSLMTCPSPAILLSAWSLASEIVPNIHRFRLRVMNTHAEAQEGDALFTGSLYDFFAGEEETASTTASLQDSGGTGGTGETAQPRLDLEAVD